MATTVYDVEEIELQNGSKVKLKPLTIKALRKFMAEIKKTENSSGEDETLTILITACGIAIESQVPELVADKDKLEAKPFKREEEDVYFMGKETARNWICKHLGRGVSAGELFTEEVFSKEVLEQINENKVKPKFSYGIDANEVEDLEKFLIDESFENE